MFELTVPIVLLRTRREGRDDYGDPVTVTTREDLMVFAVVEGGEEPTTAGRPERVVRDLTVYVPAAAGVTADDRFEWDGRIFEVDGPPGNWDSGPWWSPGISVCRCNNVKG